MEVKDIREELRRIAGLLGEGPEPIRLSIIEREIVLEKLRRLYEALRFPVGEEAAPESIDLGCALALGTDASRETPRSEREDLPGGEPVSGLPVGEERAEREVPVEVPAAVPQAAVSAAIPVSEEAVGECDGPCAVPEAMVAGNAGPLATEPEAAHDDEPCPERVSVSETEGAGESVFEVVEVVAEPERIAQVVPVAAPSADAGEPERASRRTVQTLFGGMEEPEQRHRHKQRVIMSLYDPDPVVPPVAEAGSYGEALEVISLEDTEEEAARICASEGASEGAEASEPFAAEPAEPMTGTFVAVASPADEAAVSVDPFPAGESGLAAVGSGGLDVVEELPVEEAGYESSMSVIEKLPDEEAGDVPAMSVIEELPVEEAGDVLAMSVIEELLDEEAGDEPSMSVVEELSDEKSGEVPSMSVVEELSDEESGEEPAMSVVEELLGEESEEMPAMSVVEELPGEEAVAAPTVGMPAERRVVEDPAERRVADRAPLQPAQARIDGAEVSAPVSERMAVPASERTSVSGSSAVRAAVVPAAAAAAESVGPAPVVERPVSVAPAASAAPAARASETPTTPVTPAVSAEAPRAVRSADAAPAAGGVLGEVINHDRQTLGETINHDRQTLADVIVPQRDAASELRLGEPVGDLRRAIGLNDRFQMIHELFAGDGEAFDEAIAAFNGCETMDDCMIWICDRGYFWNPDSDGAKRLMELLERKFDR